MRRISLLAASFICFACSTPSTAMTGNQFYEGCHTNDPIIYGYVAGLMDRRESLIRMFLPRIDAAKSPEIAGAMNDELIDAAGAFCLPGHVTILQIRDMVCKYLADNPDFRNRPADELAISALQDAWPCGK